MTPIRVRRILPRLWVLACVTCDNAIPLCCGADAVYQAARHADWHHDYHHLETLWALPVKERADG